MNDRVSFLQKQFYDHHPAISAERLVLATEAYQKYAGEAVPIFRAHVFAYVLDHKAIIIREGELLVGTLNEQVRAANVFPEYSSGVAWLKEELPGMPTRATDPFEITPEDQETILKYLDYWDYKSTEDIMAANMPEEYLEAESCGVFKSGGRGLSSGCVHPNFSRVLHHGFRWHIEQCQKNIKEAYADRMSIEKQAKVNYWRALIIALEAGIRYANRYADKAEEMAETETDSVRKAELLEIARICRKVPENAPETFHEAMQHHWFMHLMIHIETNAAANQLGRMDMNMYPFYERDLKEGRIDRERALELFELLFIKVNTLFFISDNYYAIANAGMPMWQELAVGGVDNEGNDASNELSEIILEAADEMKMAQPPLAFRYNAKNPEKLFRKAIEMNQRGLANPAFYNDEIGMCVVEDMGGTKEQMYNWSLSGCVEVIPGGGVSDACPVGGYINGPKCLELVLHNGVDPVTGKDVGLHTGDPKDFTSIDQVIDALQKQINHFWEKHTAAVNATMSVQATHLPCVYYSFLVDGCIENGKSLQEGGALFNTTNVFMTGPATVADSLAAINQAVFKDQKLTMEELIHLCDTNFEGQEKMRQYLIERAPKFGNDDKEVDDIIVDIVDRSAQYVQNLTDCRGARYSCGTQTQTHNVSLGSYVGATPDGRLAFTPFSDNASPHLGRDTAGPTAAANSVSKFVAKHSHGGTLYNIRFDPNGVRGPQGCEILEGIVKGFFDNGGYHIQMNVVDNETLHKAQEEPENYRDLVVRVSGFLAYFTELDRSVQDNIIERTPHLA